MRDDRGLASEVLEKVPNKYMAVVVSSKRARALNDGARPLIKSSAAKPTTLAMEEVAAGAVTPETEEQKLAALQKEKELLPPPKDTPDTEAKSEPAAEPEAKTKAETEVEDKDVSKTEPESKEK